MPMVDSSAIRPTPDTIPLSGQPHSSSPPTIDRTPQPKMVAFRDVPRTSTGSRKAVRKPARLNSVSATPRVPAFR
ncbi:hypothetical protein D3C81_1739970 [compost metagenome]